MAAAVPLPSGAPSLHLRVARSSTTDPSSHEPFPTQGESAIAIPSFGYEAATADQHAVPIASVAKLMTAYVTLQRLPLAPDASGPTIVVGAADVLVYRADVRTGQSNAKVVLGEVLTERQLLEGLLVPSASNFAVLLAEMVAGSEYQMTLDMNSQAVALGLHDTTYADVSGFDPATQSSAVDELRLAELLMRNPTFASIVRLPGVTLPVAGYVPSFTPYAGQGHVIGVKAGYTSMAGGCDVMAYDAPVGSREIEVFVVVLGQYSLTQGRSDLMAAARAAYVLASATAKRLRPWRVLTVHDVVGTIGWATDTVGVIPTTTVVVPTFTGVGARVRVVEVPWPRSGVSSGRVLATVFVSSGSFRERAQLVAAATLARASIWQRLS